MESNDQILSRRMPKFLRQPFQVSLAVAYLAIGFGAGICWAHRTSLPPSSCFTVSETKIRPATHDLREAECAIDSCIVGTVSNNCDRTFRAVFLDFNLLDSSDVEIGTTDGLVQNLEPHNNAAVHEQQLEGVVGKRKDSLYEAGKRTGSWIK